MRQRRISISDRIGLREEYKVRGRLNPSMVVMSLLSAVFCCPVLSAHTIFVDVGAPGAQTGASWQDAFVDLQSALAAWSAGDEILIAKGVYTPAAPGAARTSTFNLVDGVVILGGYAGYAEPDPNLRDIAAYETILSGDLDGNDVEVPNAANLLSEPTRGENCYHVITGDGAVSAVLDGLTICAGNASLGTSELHKTGGAIKYSVTGSDTLKVSRCTFKANSAFDKGGAIRCEGQSIIKDCVFTGNYGYKGACFDGKGLITGCAFENNYGYDGGAIYAYNRGTDVTVRNSRFDNNTANYGGAIACYSNTVMTINKCSFTGNHAAVDGGALINRWTTSPIVTNCTFSSNTAADQGGAIHSDYGTHAAQFANCVFAGNSANWGGAIYNENIAAGMLVIKNCLLTDNHATYRGGAIEDNGSTTISNCTIADNTAGTRAGGLFNSAGEPVITDCIFWDNMDSIGGESAQIDYDPGDDPNINYSSVQAWSGDLEGKENLGSNPLFLTDPTGDYYYCLSQTAAGQASNSPCLNSGSNTAANLEMDAYTTRTDRVRDTGKVDRGFHWPVQWVYYVNANGGSDSYSGTSPQQAFETIQKGIDTAWNGDTVIVYPGNYLEPNFQTPEIIEISGKDIILRSLDPNDANVVENTVIRGVVEFLGTETSNCVFKGLTVSDFYHGAVYGNHTQATLSHCMLRQNGPCGGTVLENWDGLITNCLIANNEYYSCGYGPVISGCRGLMQNCTVANNLQGIGVADDDTFNVQNCIIYYNGGAQFSVGTEATLNISFCNVAGGPNDIINDGTVNWGPGNIDTDPCFVTFEGDYNLLPYSNCIDAASNSKSLHETIDLAGNQRIVDAGADMGCYEFQGILHVDPTGTGLFGLKWSDALGDLQEALNMATGAPKIKEIRVSAGTYRPTQPAGDRTASFAMVNGVTLKGGYAGLGPPDPDLRNVRFYETTLSGDLDSDDGPGFTNNTDNSYHVVTSDGADQTAVLDGFTITAGNANGAAPQNLDKGGGIYAASTSPTLTNCTFQANHAVSGGAACFSGGAPTATSCLFAANTADTYGGGIYDTTSALLLINCTISQNTAGTQGGGIYSDTSDEVTNCILWANADNGGSDESAQIHSYASGTKINYSCVQGLTPTLGGLGNIAENPLFVDAPAGDYHLKSQGWRWNMTQQDWVSDVQTSPCIDRGNPGMSLADEPLTVPADPDNQSGANVRINMGMYGGDPEASMCPPGWVLLSDMSNDGIVNAVDFAIQAENWLQNIKNLPGDLDRDGAVNQHDLAQIANQWLNTDAQSQ